MQRSGRKNPRLQEKLDALKRELSRVEADIQGISRAVETPDPEKAMRQLRRVAREPVARELPVTPVAPGVDRAGAGRLYESSPVTPTSYPGIPDMNLPGPEMPLPKVVPDQRFATYFGSGSLHSVRPLRQERRVQRNKALFMMGMALLLLYILYHVIFS